MEPPVPPCTRVKGRARARTYATCSDTLTHLLAVTLAPCPFDEPTLRRHHEQHAHPARASTLVALCSHQLGREHCRWCVPCVQQHAWNELKDQAAPMTPPPQQLMTPPQELLAPYAAPSMPRCLGAAAHAC